jgi:hypothetical protein
MKIILIVAVAITLAACRDERPKINGITDVSRNEHKTWGIVCIDNIKYINAMGGGITAKINETTRLPERCTE